MELTEEDLVILNSKIGLKHLLANKKVDLEKALRGARFELQLREIQAELVKLQLWVISQGKKVMVLVHGGDPSEKSGIIRKILSHNNPRHYRVEVNIPQKSNEHDGDWYFKSFVEKLPQPGEMVFWDRSWYNRAIYEPIHSLCTEEDYEQFMGQVNEFERMLVESGIQLIKIFINVGKKEQIRILREIKSSPLTKWKLTPFDELSKDHWEEYQENVKKMLQHTSTSHAPWTEISTDVGDNAILLAAKSILDLIPYQGKKGG